ncbi:MAG: 4-(cytidine 5'-diphospho)-2-C-methyl-D-erythritol kinase [Candidatus Omnitrophica bacterium]|nr:4-(cytidine 5'-diphospho)-2-C-methyl-D-erythritol kinase [Candidatus Omnitrophota bacterium]MCM8816151.1 4-(cytidine 5'-diphospho)-2-C-methyl-D-erythritol kinase [Candidatus Omnitrophota bacterium]
MEKIKIRAPAKLNLYLEVIGKRKDGYHNICSIVEKVNLFDQIEITPSESNLVEFHGPWKIPEVNTVSKTIKILSLLFPETRKNPVKITVRKNIPPGSGLGGASSDAAAVLKAYNSILKLGLSTQQLIKIGEKIGSDVPAFIYDVPCVIEGRGEIVHPLENLPSLFFDLFVPDVEISTKSVYENLTPAQLFDLTQARLRIKIFLSVWKDMRIDELEKLLFNRLEEVTLNLNKKIAEGKKIIEEVAGKRFVLTGSGGGIYAIGNKTKLDELPEVIRDWRHYKIESYRKTTQKEEQHGNY